MSTVIPLIDVRYENVPVRLPVDPMRDSASDVIAGWKAGWRRKEIRIWHDPDTGRRMGEWNWVS